MQTTGTDASIDEALDVFAVVDEEEQKRQRAAEILPVLNIELGTAVDVKFSSEFLLREVLVDAEGWNPKGIPTLFHLFADTSAPYGLSTCTNRTLRMGGWLTDFRTSDLLLEVIARPLPLHLTA